MRKKGRILLVYAIGLWSGVAALTVPTFSHAADQKKRCEPTVATLMGYDPNLVMEIAPEPGADPKKIAALIRNAGGTLLTPAAGNSSILARGDLGVAGKLFESPLVQLVSGRNEFGPYLLPKKPVLRLPEVHDGILFRAMEFPEETKAGDAATLAAKHGHFFVVPDAPPKSDVEVKELEELYGGRIFFADEFPQNDRPLFLKGVALHVSPNLYSLRVKGTSNPMLGVGRFFGRLDKVGELEIERLVPGTMAPSMVGDEFVAKYGLAPKLAEAKTALEKLMRPPYTYGNEVKYMAIIDEVLRAAKKEFGESPFFKFRHSYASKGREQIVTTNSIRGKGREAYLKHLQANPADTLNDVRIADEDPWVVHVLHSLLTNPKDVVIQKKMPISAETRVTVINGQIVNGDIWNHDLFRPEQVNGAMLWVRDLLAKLPPEYQSLTADLEVGYTGNKYFLIEANAGPEGGNMMPEWNPVTANITYSNLLRVATPVTKRLLEFYKAPMDEKVATLSKMPRSGTSRYKRRVGDIEADEFLRPLRTYMLKAFLKAPSGHAAKQLIEHYWALVFKSGLVDDVYAARLAHSFENYFLYLDGMQDD